MAGAPVGIPGLDWCDTWKWNFPVSSTFQEPDLRLLVPASPCGPEIRGNHERLLQAAEQQFPALVHEAAAAKAWLPLILLRSTNRDRFRRGQGVLTLQTLGD